MVDRHTTEPHAFLCLTDNPDGLECDWQPIDGKYPGWWAKMLLFKPHFALAGKRVIYLDLDTVIVGSVDFLFAYRGTFCILRDWWAYSYNSSVMSIVPWIDRGIWAEFVLLSK